MAASTKFALSLGVLSFSVISGTAKDTVCQRMLQVSTGQTNISDGLRGLDLSVASGLWDPAFLAFDEVSKTYKGFEIDLLKEISKRAGFTFNLTMYQKPKSESWVDALFSMTKQYDLVTYGYFQATKERAIRGAVTPDGFLDISYRLVALEAVDKEDPFIERMFTFLTPFEMEVWGALVGMMLLTALVYLFFERKNSDDFPHSRICLSGVESFFKGFLQVTGAGGYAPVSWPGKLVLASWSWFIVLFLSAYTANLASFLVVAKGTSLSYKSIDDAMSRNAKICVEKGAITNWYKMAYPSYSKAQNSVYFDEVNGDGLVLAPKLHTEGCDAIIVLKSVWEQNIKNDRNINKDCNMQLVGDNLLTLSGGWMVEVDYAKRCTSLIKDVLGYFFLVMSSEGSLETFIAALSKSTASCDAAAAGADEDEEEDSGKLSLTDMAGVFVIHAGVMVIGGFLYAFFHLSRHGHARIKKTISSPRNVDKSAAPDAPPAAEAGIEEIVCGPDANFNRGSGGDAVPQALEVYLTKMESRMEEKYAQRMTSLEGKMEENSARLQSKMADFVTTHSSTTM